MKKNLLITNLIDQYGSLLTERQREIVSGYYEFDLSLGEMAENLNITRQAVRDSLSKTTLALKHYEETFKLNFIKDNLTQALSADEKLKTEIIKKIIEILS